MIASVALWSACRSVGTYVGGGCCCAHAGMKAAGAMVGPTTGDRKVYEEAPEDECVGGGAAGGLGVNGTGGLTRFARSCAEGMCMALCRNTDNAGKTIVVRWLEATV